MSDRFISIGKSAFKVVAFVLVLCLVIGRVNEVLMLKTDDGINQTRLLYAQSPDTVDVLFLGSSHAYVNINTGTLWEDQGIASYIFGAEVQSIAASYYYLQEALKTQRPKLVVLDIFRAIERDPYLYENHAYSNIHGLRDPLIRDAVAHAVTSKKDVLLGWPVHHNRYSLLSKSDFQNDEATKDKDSWKGYRPFFVRESVDWSLPGTIDEACSPLPDQASEYLQKIIELTQDENISLLLVCAPWPYGEWERGVYNSVKDIAVEYGIPFLSGEELFVGADLTFSEDDTDLADTVYYHLNEKGSTKYSRYLGEYIKANYDIPDRRGEEGYESWQTDADNIRAKIEDKDISGIENLSEWFSKVVGTDRFTLVMNFPGGASESEDISRILSALKAKGARLTDEDLERGFIVIMQDGRVIELSSNSGFLWHKPLFSDELMVKRSRGNALIRLGYDKYIAPNDKITALLYDDLTGMLVEVATWSTSLPGDKGVLESA